MVESGGASTGAGVAGTETAVEVAIVGGGLAGLSLAAALGTAGVPTACIDRDSPATQSGPQFDLRTTAIAFGSQQVLAGSGIWRHIGTEAGAILDIRVADHGSPLFVHYDHREIGSTPLGWIVENSVMRQALFARMTELPCVRHIAPAAVTEIERGPEVVRIRTADGGSLRARLVVGADGRGSLVRQHAAIPVTRWPYNQTAIICNIGHERPHHGLAVEHFYPTGPFAVLPLTGNRSSIVWSEQSERVPAFLALSSDNFAAEIARRAGPYLGAVRVLGGRAAYPLTIQLAERQIDRRLALVGDAAHGIHPIAGQGLNLGLRDVAALAEVVVDQYRLGLDVGAPEVLARFQRWRRFDNWSLALACDSLVHLFSNRITPIRLARDLGLGIVNHLPPVRRLLMRHAMGVVGDLPRLVRGEML